MPKIAYLYTEKNRRVTGEGPSTGLIPSAGVFSVFVLTNQRTFATVPINPENTFSADIKSLLSKYPVVDPAAMGCPKDWENEPLWQ